MSCFYINRLNDVKEKYATDGFYEHSFLDHNVLIYPRGAPVFDDSACKPAIPHLVFLNTYS
jgi:hypothetical protein